LRFFFDRLPAFWQFRAPPGAITLIGPPHHCWSKAAMDLSARGKKRVCMECHEAFYDLNRDPAPCPGCGHVHPLDAFIIGKAAPAPVAVAKKVDPMAEIDTDDDDADDTPVGNNDLDDDDDGLAVVAPIVVKVNDED
jgi:hypothetical protein